MPGGFGCARPLNPYYGYYDPFWGLGYGYNSWNWGNNWGWRNNYYDPYNRIGHGSGYNRGYREGYNNGRFDNYYGHNSIGDGRRQITAARGSNGSRNVYTGKSNQVTRPTRGGKRGTAKTVGKAFKIPAQSTSKRPTRGTSNPSKTVGKPAATRSGLNSNRPNSRPRATRTIPAPTKKMITPSGNSSPRRPVRSTTPERYKTPSTPSNYSRPRGETSPNRTTVRPKTPVQQRTRPNYNKPRQSNTYNKPTITPKQTQTRPSRNVTRSRQPTQQSRPTYNNSRSKPTYNRSTPTYSAPKNSGGGGSSRSSSTRPSRR